MLEAVLKAVALYRPAPTPAAARDSSRSAKLVATALSVFAKVKRTRDAPSTRRTDLPAARAPNMGAETA